MKKTIFLLFVIIASLKLTAQETETVLEHPGKDRAWSKTEALTHEKTLDGETWYNPGYTKTPGEIKDEWRFYKRFNISPRVYDNDWEFSLPLTNLNYRDKNYFNPSTPNKPVNGKDIVWGFGIGLVVEKDTFDIMVLIRTADTIYYDGSKGRLCRYTVFDGNRWSEWKNRSIFSTGNFDGAKLIVNTTDNSTTLEWGDCCARNYSYSCDQILLSFPKHCQGITYVEVECLPQSKILIGEATLKYEKVVKEAKPNQNKARLANKPQLTK